MTIRARVIQELLQLPFADDVMTAVELAKATGLRLNSLSSVLNRMAKSGSVVRVPGSGPRSGYGYRLRAASEIKTSWQDEPTE